MAIQPRFYTLDEYQKIAGQPQNVERVFELIGGEIIEKMPSSTYVSEIAMRLVFHIMLFLQREGIEGHVTGEAGAYNIAGEVYAPDVAFKRTPTTHTYPDPNPPELAVEVVSRSDQRPDREERLQVKIGNYLAAGVVLWVVRPDSQEIYIYTPGQPVQILRGTDTLSGGAVLPGFSMPLSAVFQSA